MSSRGKRKRSSSRGRKGKAETVDAPVEAAEPANDAVSASADVPPANVDEDAAALPSEAELKKLRASDLKELLAARGLATDGKKSEVKS